MPNGRALDFGPVLANLDALLVALAIAMGVALCAFAIGLVLGAVVAAGRLSRNTVIRSVSYAYTQAFRGVALYVLVIWVYFGLAIAIGLNLTALVAGIVSLGLLTSGYMSEIIRAGLVSVAAGQREAGLAMGLTRSQVTRYIIVPQTWKVILPASVNQLVDTIKDSAILGVIGVPELLFETQRLSQMSYRPFEFYTAAAVLYLAMVLIVAWGGRVLERRLRREGVSTVTVSYFPKQPAGSH
ncbi:putative glutamine transporter subunit; membrane component of ABC superfamily [Mesorhizobium sp. SOD10]|nr:putative glutamine transporter subunit; membrane component of ABC superfamily [Mesorhizobium sp. SOD10]